MKTRVAIVGAGPAGLVLSHLLAHEGIDSIIVETKSRAYVEQRVRAGVLEYGTATLLREMGVGERMEREGLRHDGIQLRFEGARHRIDFRALTGKVVTVYGQQEVVKDLIAARLEAGGTILFDATDTAVDGLDSARPSVHFRDAAGAQHRIDCDFIAGCDGFHGIARPSIPAHVLRVRERVYPFAWLGILAESKPANEELTYSLHERGFALLSLRSPTMSRLYLQCAPDEDLDQWPDARIWDELSVRLGCALDAGPVLQKLVTPMRSFVAEPMQYGRLFLAGDSAHIVPPTGAKGMNLAVADARLLARALSAFYRTGDESGLAAYTQRCLRNVWRAQHFSWWMTSLLHRFSGPFEEFDYRRQVAELEQVASSADAARVLAANYTDACSQ
ncbi:MAG: 4-hydroxybenzoate 3-monooxygenase [Bryobacteraceae bacterium]